MADTAITATVTYPGPSGVRLPGNPALVTGSYVANDTDNHAMKFNTLGKRFITYVVTNPSNKDVTITIYGAPTLASEVGETGVFLIGTSETASAGTTNDATTDQGAVFFIIRCTSSATPDGSTVTIHAHLMPT